MRQGVRRIPVAMDVPNAGIPARAGGKVTAGKVMRSSRANLSASRGGLSAARATTERSVAGTVNRAGTVVAVRSRGVDAGAAAGESANAPSTKLSTIRGPRR